MYTSENPIIVSAGEYVALTPENVILQLTGVSSAGEPSSHDWKEEFLRGFIEAALSRWSDSFRGKVFPRLVIIVPFNARVSSFLSQYCAKSFTKISTSVSLATDLLWQNFYLTRQSPGVLVVSAVYPSKEGKSDLPLLFAETVSVCAHSYSQPFDSLRVGIELNSQEAANIKVLLKSMFAKSNESFFMNIFDPFSFGSMIAAEFEQKILRHHFLLDV